MALRKFSKKILFSFITMGLLFATACKKDNDGGGGVIDPGTKKLVKLEEDANNYVTLDYNTDGTLKKVMSIQGDETGNETSILHIAYNANKTVKEITSEDGPVMKYTYANNQISKVETFVEDQLVSTSEYTYQGGRLAAVTATISTEDEEGEPLSQPYMKNSFTYYGNGDVKENTIYIFNPIAEEFQVASVRKFEQYDNKINPVSILSVINMSFIATGSARNPLLEKAFDENGALTETIQNQFTYDAQGYPLTCKTTTTEVGEAPEVMNIKYHYN